MKFREDPRMKIARRILALGWIYFTLYLAAIMVTSYILGIKPYVWGLPRWVAIGNILVPAFFVILLVFVAEKLIPDIPLTDGKKREEEE
jgi:uncharacterized membrane protein YhdT